MRELPKSRKIFARKDADWYNGLAMPVEAKRGMSAPRSPQGMSERAWPLFVIPNLRVQPQAFPNLEIRRTPDSKVENPLPSLPGPEIRGNIDSQLENTSGHELNHVLVAMGSGYDAIWVSVTRNGNSLGRTVLPADMPMDTFQAVAAGGAVATHDGCACGFHSDLSKVEFGSLFPDGITPTEAVDRARGIIKQTHKDVRERAAQIIGYLREVPGDWIPLILERAKLELAGKIPNDYAGDGTMPQKEPPFDKGTYRVIEHWVGGGFTTYYLIDGKKKEMCGFCQGIEGYHRQNCILIATNLKTSGVSPRMKIAPSTKYEDKRRSRLKLEETTDVSPWSFIKEQVQDSLVSSQDPSRHHEEIISEGTEISIDADVKSSGDIFVSKRIELS